MEATLIWQQLKLKINLSEVGEKLTEIVKWNKGKGERRMKVIFLADVKGKVKKAKLRKYQQGMRKTFLSKRT